MLNNHKSNRFLFLEWLSLRWILAKKQLNTWTPKAMGEACRPMVGPGVSFQQMGFWWIFVGIGLMIDGWTCTCLFGRMVILEYFTWSNTTFAPNGLDRSRWFGFDCVLDGAKKSSIEYITAHDPAFFPSLGARPGAELLQYSCTSLYRFSKPIQHTPIVCIISLWYTNDHRWL